MAQQKPEETINLVCPKCKKKAIYYRTDGTFRCNRCGYEGKQTEV